VNRTYDPEHRKVFRVLRFPDAETLRGTNARTSMRDPSLERGGVSNNTVTS